MASSKPVNPPDAKTRRDLAAMYRLAAHYGWDDTVWNHISARSSDADDAFYMHRFGLMFDEVCASNLIKINDKGAVIDGPDDVNTTGFVIHSAVYIQRPDVRFVFHAHPRSALAATTFERVPLLVQDSAPHYGRIGYHDWEGISLDLAERTRIADALGDKPCLILRNHGLLTVGATAGECFMHMYYLIRSCEVALQAHASGRALVVPTDAVWQHAREQSDNYAAGKYEWPALLRLCERLDSGYKD